MYLPDRPPEGSGGAPAPPPAASTRLPRNVWALGLTSLLTDVSSEMVTSVLPLYLVVQLQWSPAAFGAVDGAYQGVAALVRLGGGMVADRWRSPKAVALTGYAISAVAKLGYAFGGAAWAVLAAALFSDRVGKGLRTAPRDALVAASVPAGRLGAAFGLHRTMDAFGAAAGPALVFGLLTLVPGRVDVVFLVSFWLAATGVAAIALLVDGRVAEGAGPRRVVWSGPGELVRAPAVRGVIAAAAALALVSVSDGFLYLVAQRRYGFDARWMPLLFVGTQLTYFALAAASGAAVDRRGARPVVLAGHAALALAYAWLAFGPVTPWAVLVAVALLGSYYAATDGVFAALTSRVVPPELRGTALGLLTTGTTGGRALAAVMFGGLWTASSPTTALTAALAALVAAIGLAAWMLPSGRPPAEARP